MGHRIRARQEPKAQLAGTPPPPPFYSKANLECDATPLSKALITSSRAIARRPRKMRNYVDATLKFQRSLNYTEQLMICIDFTVVSHSIHLKSHQSANRSCNPPWNSRCFSRKSSHRPGPSNSISLPLEEIREKTCQRSNKTHLCEETRAKIDWLLFFSIPERGLTTLCKRHGPAVLIYPALLELRIPNSARIHALLKGSAKELFEILYALVVVAPGEVCVTQLHKGLRCHLPLHLDAQACSVGDFGRNIYRPIDIWASVATQ